MQFIISAILSLLLVPINQLFPNISIYNLVDEFEISILFNYLALRNSILNKMYNFISRYLILNFCYIYEVEL